MGSASRVVRAVQEALETMVVRVVEEKVEQAVSAALAPPDTSLFGELSDQIRVLDLYLQTLKPMHVLLRDFCASVRATLPASAAAASVSLEGLLTILQARARDSPLASRRQRLLSRRVRMTSC